MLSVTRRLSFRGCSAKLVGGDVAAGHATWRHACGLEAAGALSIGSILYTFLHSICIGCDHMISYMIHWKVLGDFSNVERSALEAALSR